MGRFRTRRGLVALALLPAVALIATSMSLAAGEREAKLKPGKSQVKIGKKVTLRGKFPGAPNAAIEIRFRPAGAKAYRKVRNASTGPKGGYKVRVRPRGTGLWRAKLANPERVRSQQPLAGATAPAIDAETKGKRVRVKSRTTAAVSRRHVNRGQGIRVSGRVRPGNAGRKIVVKVGGKKLTTKTNSKGKFSRSWTPPGTGTYKVRVRAAGDRKAARSKDRAGKVTVYRPAAASYYGPGFYGNRTACGQTLTPGMLGVAHKTMPCGTKLRLKYGSRTVSVRVIDRGPYAGHREFDLTAATKSRLGFGSTGTVWSSK